MKKEVNLHFSSTSRGPGRVVENLARGLVENGWNVYANDIPRLGTYQGCLQMVPAINSLGRDSLMGPNLFVVPSEWGEFCRRFNHYVVPGEWVSKMYQTYPEMDHATIDVWPVGIDTETWLKSSKSQKNKALVYFKSRDSRELESITSSLRNCKVDFRVLRYGEYEEKDLYEACLECNLCVLLTGTESQGIAYMQIMSMGLPCYVINKSGFDYFGKYKEFPAESTSVPFFDKSCGIVDDLFEEQNFLNFLESLGSFDPGSFIRESFGLRKCAEKYADLLKKYQ